MTNTSAFTGRPIRTLINFDGLKSIKHNEHIYLVAVKKNLGNRNMISPFFCFG